MEFEVNSIKKKIILWGKGGLSDYVLKSINPHFCNVLGWVDRKFIEGNVGEETFISYQDLKIMDYDYIVVASRDYTESILRDIDKLGVNKEKVICFWQVEREKYPIFLPLVVELLIEKEKLEYRVLNAPYECKQKNIKKLNVLGLEETMEKLLTSDISMVRFGDGEYGWMLNECNAGWFQMKDDSLTERLNEIIFSNDENIMVAISDVFGNLDDFIEEVRDEYRCYLNTNNYRQRIMEYLLEDRLYGNAIVSRPYWNRFDKSVSRQIFEKWKMLFSKKDVLVVEGEYVRTGMGNDLFSGCNSIRRVLCPFKDAFRYYYEIFDVVKELAKKTDLILVALGPTATVLCYDLAKLGFRTIDIGQVDAEYEWFLRKSKDRIRISSKGVAESKGGRIPVDLPDDKYLMEICARIHTNEF